MSFRYNGNIIDIEASSLSLESYPIEIALINNRGETFNSLIKPCKDWHDWNKESEAIHGIRREQLFDEGETAARVCEAINDLASGENYYSDYWVCDDRWLTTLFAATQIPTKLRCLPFEYFMPDEQLRDWQLLKNQSSLALDLVAHRALNDVHIIKEALDALAKRKLIKKQHTQLALPGNTVAWAPLTAQAKSDRTTDFQPVSLA